MPASGAMGVRENKLVVLGAGGVGKTSLVVQFLEGFFAASYKPTVEDYYRHTIQMPDGIFHTVEILDTAGSHHFPAMRELSIRSGRGFVLVFSVDSLQSFHEAVQLWELITRIRGKEDFKLIGAKVPLILVGNKSDLIKERQVSEDLVTQTRAEMMNDCGYIETSAKYNFNVNQLFVQLMQQARSLEEATTVVDMTARRTSRRLSRRLSSFGNLPNWTLRRKSSGAKLTSDTDLNRMDNPKCVIL